MASSPLRAHRRGFLLCVTLIFSSMCRFDFSLLLDITLIFPQLSFVQGFFLRGSRFGATDEVFPAVGLLPKLLFSKKLHSCPAGRAYFLKSSKTRENSRFAPANLGNLPVALRAHRRGFLLCVALFFLLLYITLIFLHFEFCHIKTRHGKSVPRML